MNSIEITTSQNVTIEYKAAGFFERLLAWMMDAFFVGVLLGIVFGFIVIILPKELHNAASVIILSPIYLFYHLLFEVFNNGASWGKTIMGLRVVKLNNDKVGVYDYFMRWAFRLIDVVLSLGIIATISITSSPRNQRIGDYLADTTVIKIVKSGRMSLKRIRELELLQNYKPMYPEIVAFSEDDMLVIKEVIDRSFNYPGESSSAALEAAIRKIEVSLDIKVKNRNTDFLKTLIKDYVALTR